ncbi:MAG TPA: hypothetical protein VK179_14100 [Bacteroidales bacterium]|nr:hypothetical protein [Bacteroidales bacterium]
MKKVFPVVLFIMLINCSFGQEMKTLMQLRELSISLGCAENTELDTLFLKARVGKMDIRISEQLLYLIRAAELHNASDYQNSIRYLRKVGINDRYPEYYNMKMQLYIRNFASLKDLENTVRFFYIVNKGSIYPYNLTTMRSIIRDNFKRKEFDNELAHYYYYHRRLKLLDEIGFTE